MLVHHFVYLIKIWKYFSIMWWCLCCIYTSFFCITQHENKVRFAWWFLTPLLTIFQLYRDVVVSVIGGRNRSTRRKPPTCHSHWQTLAHNVVHLALTEIRTHNTFVSVVIGTDCIGSCISNYHTTKATTASLFCSGYHYKREVTVCYMFII